MCPGYTQTDRHIDTHTQDRKHYRFLTQQVIRSQSTASAQESTYAHTILQTHGQTPWTGNDSYYSLPHSAKPNPCCGPKVWARPLTLISTFDFDPDLWPWPSSKVTVMPKQDFWYLTLTFGLRPWPTIPAWPWSRSTPIPKIEFADQTVQAGECLQMDGRTDRWTDATNFIISLLC